MRKSSGFYIKSTDETNKSNVVSQENRIMIIEEIYVQRDNKKNVLLTVAMLAVTNAVINNIGNMVATGNIIMLIAS